MASKESFAIQYLFLEVLYRYRRATCSLKQNSTVRTEISAVCEFCGFHGHLLIYSENFIRENLLVCNNYRFVRCYLSTMNL